MLRATLALRLRMTIILWVGSSLICCCSRQPAPKPVTQTARTQTQERSAEQSLRARIVIAGLERKPSCPEGLSISIDNIEKVDWSSCEIDLKPFWRNLHVPSKGFNDSSSIHDVSKVTGDLDGDGIDERILRLELRAADTEQKVRFIVLKRPDNNGRDWRRLAYLDVDYFHLDPQARVASNGRGHWLVISQNEAAWGSNLYQENEEWYTLKDGALVEALQFPVKGSWAFFWRPDLFGDFETTVRMVPFDGAKDRLELYFQGDFGIGGEFSIKDGGARDSISFHITRKVTFSKRPDDVRFEFEEAASEIPESIFGPVYDINNRKLTNSVILTFAYPALLRLVRDKEQSKLIRKFLSKARDSKEKRDLLRQIQ